MARVADLLFWLKSVVHLSIGSTTSMGQEQLTALSRTIQHYAWNRHLHRYHYGRPPGRYDLATRIGHWVEFGSAAAASNPNTNSRVQSLPAPSSETSPFRTTVDYSEFDTA
ncbi:hypothetical protein BDW42DRAFT_16420 [Aspergillus taichungensis]|uniref:Uncharacterized protein n=1 Tax=Aspergillus taichungensis TaxID=482145 RepID=A0A2J5HHZ0_9EURO|nr:hypothetical protein BDW42DRAFT_16420 [Aspergillus taichungensis]